MDGGNNVNPTDKQIKAVNAVITGAPSLSQAMQEAGYSNKTSLNPGVNFVDSKGVKKYLETLDDKSRRKFNMAIVDKALEVYLDALEATKYVPVKLTDEGYVTSFRVAKEPDHQIRIAAADRVVKIYGADKALAENRQLNNFDLNGEEVFDFNKKFLKFIEQYN